VREVRRGEIIKERTRDSTVFLWVDNFTCGHAYICAALHAFYSEYLNMSTALKLGYGPTVI
jgi:hypothetical protein